MTDQPGGAEYRVTHVDDPVPRLPPPELGFRHTSPEYWLSTGNATTTDYGVADVKVCEGFADLECNGGTVGLDVDAHLYYFLAMASCQDLGAELDETGSAEGISDEELAARLDTHIEMAMQSAAKVEEVSPAAT